MVGGAKPSREYFILQKIAGLWKIARYSFSTTLPT